MNARLWLATASALSLVTFLVISAIPVQAQEQTPAPTVPPSSGGTSLYLPSIVKSSIPSSGGSAHTPASGNTPLQKNLLTDIAERKLHGLPAPTVLSAEHTVEPLQASHAAGSDALQYYWVTGNTVIYFDDPSEADQVQWPRLLVTGELPNGVTGVVKPGDYTEAARAAQAQALPGIWGKYAYGHEPRTYTLVETLVVAIPADGAVVSSSQSEAPAGSSNARGILLGFTQEGEIAHYTVEGRWESCFLGSCVTLANAAVRFGLNWAVGLRFPLKVTLDAPSTVYQDANWSAVSSVAGEDWSEADYIAAGVFRYCICKYPDGHTESQSGWCLDLDLSKQCKGSSSQQQVDQVHQGREYLLELGVLINARAFILGTEVLDGSGYVNLYSQSKDFVTPLGPNTETVKLPPADVKEYDLSLLGIIGAGLKFELDHLDLGSDRITADWEATGGNVDAKGTIEYRQPNEPVQIPITAQNTGLEQVKLTNFRYWLTHAKLGMVLYVRFTLFGYGVTPYAQVPLPDLDLSTLTGFVGLGNHPGTSDTVTATVAVAPQPPVSMRITSNSTTVHSGDPVSYHVVVRSPRQVDLTNLAVTMSPATGDCARTNLQLARNDPPWEYNCSVPSNQKDVYVQATVTATYGTEQVADHATVAVPVIDGKVGSGSPGSCTEAALNAEIAAYHEPSPITFDCGGAPTLPLSQPIVVTGDLALEGGFANSDGTFASVTLSGNGAHRLFDVRPGARLALTHFVLSNGASPSESADDDPKGGGAVRNLGVTALSAVTLISNTGTYGGAVVSAGSLTIADSLLVSNRATNQGGALYTGDAALTIQNSIFRSNQSVAGGGAMVIWGSNSEVTIAGSTFADNLAAGPGGAIQNGWLDGHAGRLTIKNSRLTGNQVVRAWQPVSGGALFLGPGATTVLEGVTLAGNVVKLSTAAGGTNVVPAGGAIFNAGMLTVAGGAINGNTASSSGQAQGGGIFNAKGALTVNGTIISQNTAGNLGQGGGLYNDGGRIALTDCTIGQNSASDETSGGSSGGGIFNQGGVLTFNRCLVSGNVADGSAAGEGGGIYNAGGAVDLMATEVQGNFANGRNSAGAGIRNVGGDMTISASGIDGNSSAAPYLGDGGAIANSGAMTLTNSTISRNQFGGGIRTGGIYNDGSMLLTNCTVVDNEGYSVGGLNGRATTAGSIIANNRSGSNVSNCNGALLSFGYNIEDAATCGLNGAGDSADTDPGLDGLMACGITQAYAVLSNSAAISRIPAGQCFATTDQCGVARPAQSACSSGAVEFALPTGDGVLTSNGGTVVDTESQGASLTLPPNVLKWNTSVDIAIRDFKRAGGFTGLEAPFVQYQITPRADGDLAAAVTLPLAKPPLPAGAKLALLEYDPVAETVIDTGVDAAVAANGMAVIANGINRLAIFTAGTDHAQNVNTKLQLLDVSTAYHLGGSNTPNIYAVIAHFKNVSAAALRDLSFKVIELTGGNSIVNAYSGKGAGSIVPVPSRAFSDTSVLEPGESFTVTFAIQLTTNDRFSFYVDAYGFSAASVGTASDSPEVAPTHFDLSQSAVIVSPNRLPTITSLPDASARIYLPLIDSGLVPTAGESGVTKGQ